MITGGETARFGIDVLAVPANQRPLFSPDTDLVQRRRVEAQIEQFAYGVRLQVDPDAHRLRFAHRLEHEAPYADLMQRQRNAQSADPCTRDDGGFW